MKQRYLEVTFRRGKAFAAYLYLPRKTRAKVTRTEDRGRGILVDFDAKGVAIGIEITAPTTVRTRDVDTVLVSLGQPRLDAGEWPVSRAA